MVADIDRKKVRESFHRQATNYDGHAVVQRRVIERLIERVQVETVSPSRFLDVGAGTGRLLARLRPLFPSAFAVGADLAFGMCLAAFDRLATEDVHILNADAERLPFAEASFDLVLSSSTFQWLTTLDRAFADVYRVLSPGGTFCFALFGEKTLFELRESYKSALGDGADRSHTFFTAADVQEALQRTGFQKATAVSELEVEMHPDVPELLRSLKRIGAGSATPVPGQGLSGRRMMLEMMETYRQRYGKDDGIPATYEVIYGVGRKANS